MKRGILRNLLLLLAILGLSGLVAPQAFGQEEDEETVEEIRERIRKQEEEAEEEARKDTQEDEHSGCQLFGDILSALLQSPAEEEGEYYPRERSRPFLYLLRGEPPPGYSHWGYLGLDADGTCLFQNRWSLAGRLTFNVQFLHLHGFSQVLFDPTGCLVSYAANAGINLLSRFLILNLFAGAFGTDLTSGALPDFGAEARIFLSSRWVLELYSLNAVYYSLRFNFLSLALRYAGNGVSLGAGLNLNNYAGVLLWGPSLRLCLWL